jgi:hypothetical protein
MIIAQELENNTSSKIIKLFFHQIRTYLKKAVDSHPKVLLTLIFILQSSFVLSSAQQFLFGSTEHALSSHRS